MDDAGQVKAFLGIQTDVTNIVEMIKHYSTCTEEEDLPMEEQLKQTLFSQLFGTFRPPPTTASKREPHSRLPGSVREQLVEQSERLS